MRLFCAILTLAIVQGGVVPALGNVVLEDLSPQESWAGRKRHPAVVHSVTAVNDGSILSLSGEWEIVIRPHHLGYPHYLSDRDTDFAKNGKRIRVPGCWESQGIGEDKKCHPYLNLDQAPKPMRNLHWGHGQYRRFVTVPKEWQGCRIWFKVGGVRNRGWFFVNKKGVGMVDCYAGAWKFEITDLVKPGERIEVTALVDNAYGARNAQPSGFHAFGGIVRDIELEATPQAFVDDAWVRGDFDRHMAEAHVTIEGKREEVRGKRLLVTVEDETKEVDLRSTPTPSTYTLEIPLRDFRAWSPEHPNLYTAKVELVANGQVIQTRYERFGVRKLEVRGREFYLNNEPFFVRGFGDDSVYPFSGFSPADRDYHLKNLAKAKKAGFNYVRLHTHCEVPEYFEAADELGILIQPELSYYFDQTMDTFDYDPRRDADERFIAFRRHPSWGFSSSGNEGSLGPAAGGLLYAYLKKTDPDRLVVEEDGPYNAVTELGEPPLPVGDFRSGPMNAWKRGAFDPPQPFLCHEYLNLTVKFDTRLEPQFTGTWLASMTRQDRQKLLDKANLSMAFGDRLQDAQHVLQGTFQKLGIEAARRDPYCDGYCFWTIVDVVVPVEKLGCSTAQGFLDCFWNEKPHGLTIRDFARFNSPRCLLADFNRAPLPPPGGTLPPWENKGDFGDTNRVFVSGGKITAVFMLANYGAPIEGKPLVWRIVSSQENRVLSEGKFDVGCQPRGPVRDLVEACLDVPEVEHPVRARLELSLDDAANDWDIWLFPRFKPHPLADVACSDVFREALLPRYPGIGREADAATACLMIAEAGSAAEKAALDAGRDVISLSGLTNAPSYRLGWWWLGTQVGSVINDHPALGDFPREEFLTPLYFRILKAGAKLPIEGIREKDLIIAGEGGEDFYAYLAETREPNGARRLRAFGLDVLSDTPEGKSLLDNFITYMKQKRKEAEK